MFNTRVDGVLASAGPATGVAVITDSRRVGIGRSKVEDVLAGAVAGGDTDLSLSGPDDTRIAAGFRVGPDARRTVIWRRCADGLDGLDGDAVVFDESGNTTAWRMCR